MLRIRIVSRILTFFRPILAFPRHIFVFFKHILAFLKLGRKALLILAMFVAVAFVAIILWFYMEPTDYSKRKDYVDLLVKIVGGIVLFWGAYFTWKRVEVYQEGQITERFTRAIDQLGATDEDGNIKLEIRLGGIYALERIARDSAKDHWQIMEVLTAYVRENAPWKGEVERGKEKKQGERSKGKSSSERKESPADFSPPRTDIQAILTVLGRRKRYEEEKKDQSLDLASTSLRKADLKQANLREAWLWRADL